MMVVGTIIISYLALTGISMTYIFLEYKRVKRILDQLIYEDPNENLKTFIREF
jgi:hypothetical protein